MSYPLNTAAAVVCMSALAVAQDFTVSVPNRVGRQIGRVLPERSNANAPFMSESHSSNLEFTAPATARIIFIREGAGYQSALGYFTYTDNVDGSVTVQSADLLVANLTEPSVVQRGDGFELKDAGGAPRTFQPGEKLGFFLIADGHNTAPFLGGWTFDYSDLIGTVPSLDAAINAQRGRGCYTSVSRLNPEMLEGAVDRARHMVMVRMPGASGFLAGADYLMCGFEDLLRTSKADDDFNDVIFVVDVSPRSALDDGGAFVYESGDPDGDGVRGLNDAFPNDASRASIERIPSSGYTMIAFEDKYPDRGDADFNDAVVAYAFELATDAKGRVKDIQATFYLVGRGASYDASLGLHLPGLPASAAGTIRVERFASGASSNVLVASRTVQSLIAAGTRRVEDVIGSTRQLLPPPVGFEFSNTLFAPGVQSAGSARLHIEFDAAIARRQLGEPPYDPFLLVANPNYTVSRIDVHLPGWGSFADRHPSLPVESGALAFVDEAGFPWALEVPNGWRFPMEEVLIEEAYPEFSGWRLSKGTESGSWFLNPQSSTGLVGPSLSDVIPVRDWSIGIPR